MSSPDITGAEVKAVLDVLEGSALSLGPSAEGFEREFAQYVGRPFAVSVSSGTAGLHLCMIAAGVTKGDLVITTPFSFIASANVILYQEAIPVFVDVEETTGNISPEQACLAIEEVSGPNRSDWLPPGPPNKGRGELRAVLPVHAFGSPADMNPLSVAARENGVVVIEDACEAVGGEYDKQKLGSIGDAGVFAFYPNKQMTTGEGGLVVTGNEDWAALFRSLRNQGRDASDPWLRHSRLGFNYRLDELSAALGLAQLRRIDTLLERRRMVANWYTERLDMVDGVSVPREPPFATCMSWFAYVVRLADGGNRGRLMEHLESVGVPTRPYFEPIHLQSFYRERFGWREGAFPVAEKLGRSSLALPFSSVMTEQQVDHVCAQLVRCL